MADWLAMPGGALHGRLRAPGDKSISHRAIMLAAIADGRSRIEGFLEAGDTRATARIFGQLGVRIDTPAQGVRIVHGVGIDGLRTPAGALDCGNSGTAMRLLAGLLAPMRFGCTLVGDASLGQRPMRRVTDPLAAMGAKIETGPDGRPPLRIEPVPRLSGLEHVLPVASAQVKSALLLAGLQARGETRVHEPRPTRDYTERMLSAFGVDVAHAPGHARLHGGQRLRATDLDVPGDFSSAAFAIVAATVVPGSDVLIEGVGIDPRRTGLLRVLEAMGADIELQGIRDGIVGSVADVRVRHAALKGIDVPVDAVADMIDEFPVLFVAAACAAGITRVRGAAELRVKESDRIRAMADGLRALGVHVEETPDGADITGGPIREGVVESRDDHRIAMAFAVAAQRATGPVRVEDVENVATSWPGFAEAMSELGMGLQAQA